MSTKTKIEWADMTWNPVSGCTKVSAGCKNCYAERMALRLNGRFGYPKAPNHFNVTLHRDKLDLPLRWRKPRRVFVCSMSDLFHEDVPFSYVVDIFATMHREKRHTFQILTKRPARMLDFLKWYIPSGKVQSVFPNVWLGVTAENQEAADERIPLLLQTPAAVRFVSCEPLLEWVGLNDYFFPAYAFRKMVLDWVIAGGESGPGARPMHPDWARGLRDQCQAAGVPFFFKQWGSWIPVDQWGATCQEKVAIANSGHVHHWPDGSDSLCVGKKRAGHLLDGQVVREWPIYADRKEI